MTATAVSPDAVATAKAAGLRYVGDDQPGIRRERSGNAFVYRGPDGRRITDESVLSRIRALAIPPAWTDVWICPLANGHMQATGRDARKRKQYRYHRHWRETRDENKYERMIAFGHALPRIRKRIESDLRLPGLPREKVLAAVVELLQSTAIRIGNDQYAKENHSYGLTTMKNRHASVHGADVNFTFRGKSGVRHAIGLHDRRLSRIVRACQDLPGQQLFEFRDHDGTVHAIDSADVNAYIQSISGDAFSAKDFRTWLGTVTCAVLLAGSDAADNATARKYRVAQAIKDVAKRLGNTPTVCRKCYVHPRVIDAYMEHGALPMQRRVRHAKGLVDEERHVLSFLEHAAAETDSERTTRQLRNSLGRKTKAA